MLNNKNLADPVKILKYDGAVRPSQKEHSFAVKYILKRVNPNWDESIFDYDEKAEVLTISGKGFKRFEVEANELDQRGTLLSKPVCLIDSLKIKKLYLSGTEVFNLWSIGGSNLELLDISNTKVQDLSPIVTMKELEILVLSKGKYSEAELKKLPSGLVLRFH
ncbi:hypothetical protein LNTAR_15642 [Lentisphaera araneosa HTCC2155]|uniref:Uncharacterized protein n=1 Tax=Lentisphaera araneosa HTCC2155 TaxID=313628 RepID=A6DMC6_9BACT|nr:hypothetical protein [Lentisphaera araneosa]EDM27116.1 hypothetical protein LNTAR_15642 [Lentisphaera araneosa HTCC2155]